MCVHDREGVSQEGKKNLHRYKERERDMYAIVEARVFVREIRVGGAKVRVLCVRERDGSREGEWKQELCVCVRERERGGEFV